MNTQRAACIYTVRYNFNKKIQKNWFFSHAASGSTRRPAGWVKKKNAPPALVAVACRCRPLKLLLLRVAPGRPFLFLFLLLYTYGLHVCVCACCVLRVACCVLHVDSERACESASISISISLSSTGTSASLYAILAQSDSGVRVLLIIQGTSLKCCIMWTHGTSSNKWWL